MPPFSFSVGERKLMTHFVVNEIKMIVLGCPQGSLKEQHFKGKNL
jgi:hypothetical protein